MPTPIDQDLVAQLAAAATSIGADPAEGCVLQTRSNLRAVVRFGDVVLKGYSPAESDYWTRESAAYGALTRSDLAPELRGIGELWIATEWLDLITPVADSEALCRSLGTTLARLHSVDAGGLPQLSLTARLHRWLNGPAPACPPVILKDLRRMIDPLRSAYQAYQFVHGDWDLPNVLVSEADPHRIQKTVDFEGSHLGDPTEDFKWQLMEGPPWTSYRLMLDSYLQAGGRLGANATERLVLAAAEWSLDLLTWKTTHGTSQFHDRALIVLEALVAGQWPEAP